MDASKLDTQTIYIIQGYHQEHLGYLQRAIFAEAELKVVKEQLHQELMNSSSTIQSLNDEVANLQKRLNE